MNQTTMRLNQTNIRGGRLLLLATVTLLLVIAGSAAAAVAITDRPVELPADGPQYTTETVTVSPISPATITAPCPDGTMAIDGGLSSESGGFTRVDVSTADADGSGWSVELWNQHPNEVLTVHAWASCLAVG